MNILISCIGKRGYLADYFRAHLGPGDRIIGTSNTRWTPGFASCDKAFVLPDIDTPEHIPAILDICKQEKVDGLFSLFDPDVEALSRNLNAVRSLGVVPIVCSAEVSRVCFDKWQTYLFLREHQFKVPTTFIDLEEAKEALRRGVIAFPLVVKPRYGYGTRHTFFTRDIEQLDAFFHYVPDMVVQQAILGSEHNMDLCLDLDGEVIAVVAERKFERHGGETEQAEAVHEPRLMEAGLRLGRTMGALGHVGPLDVDVFLQGDTAVILELNPRFGGMYPTAHLAGADFPRMVLKMIRGEPVRPCIGDYRAGVRMMKSYLIVNGHRLSSDGHIHDGQDDASKLESTGFHSTV